MSCLARPRLWIPFTVFGLFYNSINYRKLMQVILVYRNAKHFGLWNATDYCPGDTNQLRAYLQIYFSIPKCPYWFFAIAFEIRSCNILPVTSLINKLNKILGMH